MLWWVYNEVSWINLPSKTWNPSKTGTAILGFTLRIYPANSVILLRNIFPFLLASLSRIYGACGSNRMSLQKQLGIVNLGNLKENGSQESPS